MYPSLHAPSQHRRRLMAAGAAVLAWPALGGARQHAESGVMQWLPYDASQVMRINPIVRDFEMPAAVRRIEPVLTAQPTARYRQGAAGLQPPRAYVRTGQRHGVAPWLLFGVALQESMLKFGERTLPYSWTLCVRGKGMRFADYAQTLAALQGFVQARVTNVDCGAMQVNWHWHSDKLVSVERALDPYPNLAVGARILRAHYEDRRDWRRAIALYHTGSDASAETRARGERYASQTLTRLARQGVDVAALLRGERHA